MSKKQVVSSLSVEPLISGSVFSRSLQEIEGKVLTILDAISTDEVQRKALKDLVRQSIWSVSDNYVNTSLSYDGEYMYKGHIEDDVPVIEKQKVSEDAEPNVVR